MKIKIPVILVMMAFLAGLADARSQDYSEKLRLGPKKNFRAYRGEIGGLKARHIGNFRIPKRMTASSAIVYAYNEDHLVTGITHPEGNQITYGYDSGHKSRRSHGNIREVKSIGTDGTEIKTTYEYDGYYNQVTKITDPNQNAINPDIKTISITLDGNGNPDTVTLPTVGQETPIYDYDYNKYGQLAMVTDPMGSMTVYRYYPEIRPSGDGTETKELRPLDKDKRGGYLAEVIVDFAGKDISEYFVYDRLGNVTSRRDGKGVETTYEYDKDDNTTGSTLSGHNPYGEVSKVIQGISEDVGGGEEDQSINLETTFKYDLNGRMWKQESQGITTTNEYDRLNRIYSVKYKGGEGSSGTGAVSQEYGYRYDDNSNLKHIIYPKDGITDTFEYDDRDLLETKILGTGLTTERYQYTRNGNIHYYWDGDNKQYTYNHDGHGRLREVIDPLGNRVKSGYDANSNVTSVEGIGIDGKTHQQFFDFDQLDRMYKHRVVKDGGEIETQLDYKLAERKITATNPNKHQGNMTFTGAGLTDTVTDPIGNMDKSTYDSRGWIESLTESEPANADGTAGQTLTRNYSHTVLGAPYKVGDSVTYNTKKRDYHQHYYPDKHLPMDTIDPQGGVVKYTYDGLHRVKTETREIEYQMSKTPSGKTYEYDANGNLWKIIDAKGNVTTYVYDTKDRLTDIFYPGTANEHITYNGRDQVLTYKDLNGTEITNTYDDAGRLTDITITAGAGVEGTLSEHFRYDGLNRLWKAYNDDSEVTFEYDQAGRVVTETQKIKENGAAVATYIVGYGHDDNGNKTQITYPSNKIVTITPDELDRIDTIKDLSSNEIIVDYGYEGKGKVRQKTIRNVISVNAVFDEGWRPKEIRFNKVGGQGPEELIARHLEWNLVDLKQHDLEYGLGDKYKTDSGYRTREVENTDIKTNTKYQLEINELEEIDNLKEIKDGKETIRVTTHNDRHQLVNFNGKTLTYDNNGNMTGYDKASYVYNWKNQLVKSSTGYGVTVEYKYDSLGRRIAKIVKDAQSQEVTRYVHDGYQVIEERDNQDILKNRYIYGNGIDERIEVEKRMVKEDGTVQYNRFYLLHDSIGNVIGLTNHRGQMVERYRYKPLGEPRFYNNENSPEVEKITIKDGKIDVRFNRPVDPDNMYFDIRVKYSQEKLITQNDILDFDTVVRLTPMTGLPVNEILTIDVKLQNTLIEGGGHIEDVFYNEFSYSGGASETVHDKGAPRVNSVMYKEEKVDIDFSEEVDSNTLNDSVSITNEGIKIGGTIEVAGDRKYRFTPEEKLSQGVEYKIEIQGVKDLSGNTMTVFTQGFKLGEQVSQGFLIFDYQILSESSHSIVGNCSLMHGRDYEPEIGLYYYRARYYHPELGRFLQQDPMGYEDSMNMYQGFGMNPANFTDPMGNEISGNTIKYWGSYEKALKYIKYNYSLYLAGGDSASTAYKKLVSNGLVVDSGSPDDRIFAVRLAMSPSLDVFDVTPAQFGKDVLGGLVNAVTSMVSLAAKGLPGGYNPYVWAQIDRAKNWAQGKINTAIGANEGSLGYFVGETYGPAVAGGWLSAELECLNATAQTEKTLPFLGTEPYPIVQSEIALTTSEMRLMEGTSIGGDDIPVITGKWLKGTHGNAGKMPGQIAEILKDRKFSSFKDFRNAFWKAVSNDPNLSRQFSAANISRMRQGLAPYVTKAQQLGKARSYILHHKIPLQHGGGLYDLDNIIIVTPRYHIEILSPSYHY